MAILAAATRVIVAQGLAAPTALIAREAGVSTGSLFTYFHTKSELLNELYCDIKSGMAVVALEGVQADVSLHDQLLHVWGNWMNWAAAHPDQRRAVAQLGVCDDITADSRAAASRCMAGLAELLERCRAGGSMKNVPMPFFLVLVNALAEATMDFMVHDPAHADEHLKTGFEAAWRAMN